MSTRSRAARSQPAWWRERERGSVTLEIVIIFPLVILITFGVIQGAMWYHARNVALAAAEEGARAASGANGSAGLGQQKALTFVAQVGGADVLRGARAAADRTVNQVTVTVTGSSLSIFPGWGGSTISQTAFAPVERFTTG